MFTIIMCLFVIVVLEFIWLFILSDRISLLGNKLEHLKRDLLATSLSKDS